MFLPTTRAGRRFVDGLIQLSCRTVPAVFGKQKIIAVLVLLVCCSALLHYWKNAHDWRPTHLEEVQYVSWFNECRVLLAR